MDEPKRDQGAETRVFVDDTDQAVHVWTCETFGLLIAVESTGDGHFQSAQITPENRDKLILALGGKLAAPDKGPGE